MNEDKTLEFVKQKMRESLEQFIGLPDTKVTQETIKAHMIKLTYDLVPRPEWEVREDPNNPSQVIIHPMNKAAEDFLMKVNNELV